MENGYYCYICVFYRNLYDLNLITQSFNEIPVVNKETIPINQGVSVEEECKTNLNNNFSEVSKPEKFEATGKKIEENKFSSEIIHMPKELEGKVSQ